jgi:Ca2+-binding EF-hand superfamily protein
MDEEQPKPAPPPSEQVIEAKKKIGEAFSVFDREGKNVCDVREVGTIIRSLNVYPTEKQLQRWIHEIEEEEPTGFIVYEKVKIVSCTMRCASASRRLPVSFAFFWSDFLLACLLLVGFCF